MIREFSEVYAVPGQSSIIDVIDPETGLTAVNASTEADILAIEPAAVRMSWADWQADQIRLQRTPIVWEPTTVDQYNEMLNVLPPAAWIAGAFLVGEPTDHDYANGRPRFAAYLQKHDRYYVASRPITIVELREQIQQTKGFTV